MSSYYIENVYTLSKLFITNKKTSKSWILYNLKQNNKYLVKLKTFAPVAVGLKQCGLLIYIKSLNEIIWLVNVYN